ncbi:hypothetical protein SLEP1_g17758 [Rubroshorea leprosula]|uniref:DUF4283 domain-containing protein n=1 Tax=Rubroshorea leprosula TaxID=152421 RepID=A0AAV5J4D8_9ROSI|nr:hypothetical protein SLEP1_g17758 [Rubroshorea leprosula]
MMEDVENPPKAKIPKVRIPKSIWERLCGPWRNAVIIKLLGKIVDFHLLHARLLRLWRIEGEFMMIDVGLGYYIVKFSTPQDCSLVLTGGPYKMFDHYLAMQPWEPSFHLARAKALKTIAWIKLFGVLMLCYEEAIVLYLGNLEELPQSLILVEYEGLHKICFHCCEFSHKEDFCRFKNPRQSPPIRNPNAKAMVELTPTLKPNMTENSMVNGPWMVQQRKNRQKAHQWQSQASLSAANQAPKVTGTTNIVNGNSADSAVNVQRGRNVGCREFGSNRFAAIADIIEEETYWINSNAEKAVNVGGRANPMEALRPSTNIVITPIPNSKAQIVAQTKSAISQAVNTSSYPPPAPTTSFVKSKSKKSKNKNKLVGPVHKESKTPN